MTMKGLLQGLAWCIFICIDMYGQANIQSQVYEGDMPGTLFEGTTHSMKYMKLELVKLVAGASIKSKTKSLEHVIIVKSGAPVISSRLLHTVMTPGSLAVMTKGNSYKIKKGLQNQEDLYYIFSYQTKDPAKAADTATSFIRLWEDLSFRPHDRGGVRSCFDRPSSQTRRLEMHVTTLKAGLKSHEPHTHKAEEIILMFDGHTKMLIGETNYEGNIGDVYFIGSTLLHGIQNVGDKPCSYFAFQWE